MARIKQLRCKVCNEDNPLVFTYRKSKCNKCISIENKVRYKNKSSEEKTRYRERALNRYYSLTEEERKVYKEHQGKWQDNNMLRYRWSSARSRAIARNIEFTITIEDIERQWIAQNGLCYYSGNAMILTRNDLYSCSIDRYDNRCGYIPTNIVLCSSIINRMKNDLDMNEFKMLISQIYTNSKRESIY